MKSVMKVLHFLIEPFRFFGSRDLSDNIVQFFNNYPWTVYVLAFIISLGLVFGIHIYPNL